MDSSAFATLSIICALLALVFTIRYGRVRSAKSSPSYDIQSNQSNERKKAVSSFNNPDRAPGEWVAVQFDYPHVEHFADDLSSVKPIPYRPFRWGDYHVTMGIRNMPWNDWIELDQQFADYHRIVEHRIRTRGERVVKVHPGQPDIVGSGHAAAKELVYELAEFLCRRYPAVYTVVRHARDEKQEYGWYGEGRIKEITIVPLHVTYDLDREDPMTVAALLAQDDLAIMIEGTDGRYYLQGGAICIPGSWRLQDKIGMPLEEIHTTGNVPQYQSKLHLSMGRFFRRLPVDKPVIRNNYSFQVVAPAEEGAASADPAVVLDPTELAWCRTMHGNEDRADFERTASANIKSHAKKAEHDHSTLLPVDPSTVYLRTERQTLRRLPRTGAIAFTIRVYQTQVEDLAKEPGVPGRLASAVRGWSEDVAEYKALDTYKDILQYLDQSHAQQMAEGVIKEDEQASAYPF